MSLRLCERYIEKWLVLGHCCPMQPTREVRGQDMVNLALLCLVLPVAPIDQLREFLHKMNPVGVLFGPQAIICAEKLLNLS